MQTEADTANSGTTTGTTTESTSREQSDASLRDRIAALQKQVDDCTAELTDARALTESQQLRLTGFFESLPEPHVLLRPVRNQEGKISDFVHVDANEAACLYNKRERAKLVGKTVRELLPGLAVTELFDRLCDVAESGKPLILENFSYAHEIAGGNRWFDVRCVKVEDMLSLTARDVTERQEAARTLADSRKQFQLLAENASDVVLKCDAAGTITYISPSSLIALGLKPEELTGTPFRNLVHPVEWDEFESLEELIRNGTHANMELRLRVSEGGYRWFSLAARPIAKASGMESGCVAGLRDIQHAIQGREAIKTERARLRMTLETLFDPFALMQPVRGKDGKVVDFLYAEVNSAACDWLGLSQEQLLGRSMVQLFPAVETLGLMDFYRKTVETSTPSILDEVAFPFQGGTRWLDIRGVRVDDRVAFVWRDMSERHLAAERLAAAEEAYRLLATNSADVVLRMDDEDRIAWISPSLKPALGWEPEELVGNEIAKLLGSRAAVEQFEREKEAIKGGEAVAIRTKMQAKDGGVHWVGIHAGPYRTKEGRVEGIVASFRVIDDEVKGEEERAHQQEIIANERKHLVDVIEGSDTGTWEWYVQTGETVFNEIWAKLIGYRLEELRPVSIDTWIKFAHPEDLARSNALLEQCFRRETEVYECEARMQHRSGEWIWVLDRGRVVEWTEDGKPLRMLGTHRDITANMRLREELESLATTDALTGLSNRRQFEDLAHRELSRGERAEEKLSLLTMDIDRFKAINDTYGHDAGDEVLKSMARICKPHLREMDIFARIGGEEFALLMPDSSLEGASHAAERIRQALAGSSVSVDGGKSINFTVSVGVAQWLGKPEDLPGLMKRSDEALHRSKSDGRNRVCTA